MDFKTLRDLLFSETVEMRKTAGDEADFIKKHTSKARVSGYTKQDGADKMNKDRSRHADVSDEEDEEMYESASLEETFKPGKLKLQDGSTVNISKDDAKALNVLYVGLNDSNQSKMDQELMSSKKGFDSVLNFAKEV